MQRVQGRNISCSADELKVEFLRHWKNNQSVTALRCTSSDLSKLESESFVLKVAVQAGRWRGWKCGHGNHTPSCKQRWCHPWNVLGNVPADGPRGWEQCKNPPGAAPFPSSHQQGTLVWLEPCTVTFSLWMLWQVWEAPRNASCPLSPLCGGQGQLSASPRAVGGRKLQILEGILLLYSPNEGVSLLLLWPNAVVLRRETEFTPN